MSEIRFTHDAAGQLTSADYLVQADEDFADDANGNRTGGRMVIGDQLFRWQRRPAEQSRAGGSVPRPLPRL